MPNLPSTIPTIAKISMLPALALDM